MKIIKSIIIILLLLLFTYIIINIYLNRIEKINNREIIVISESQKDR